ncbi:MarR family winged helix-turn-helix transcriptional regulator [Maritalea mediterranea]|uniref:MarR family transcriptional regulator n=1 Tax=Maritalea mediterranea TaxID=2909667 RepID=A0ABS9EAR3_9HYPH|nr:MarR family transcriptional regulator [Maritalea mediterranea]MCF4099965.1 MarR family transcriptional regulator [Maritalea mediterranea]
MMNYEDIPLHWVNRLSFLVRRELGQKFARAGHKIAAEEWAVLLMLWQEDGRLPSAIAELTFRDRTTVTRLLDGMEKKQMIRREADPHDRRKMRVFLTDKGRALEAQLKPIAQDLIAQAQQNLSGDEVAQLTLLLRKMTQNLTPNSTR